MPLSSLCCSVQCNKTALTAQATGNYLLFQCNLFSIQHPGLDDLRQMMHKTHALHQMQLKQSSIAAKFCLLYNDVRKVLTRTAFAAHRLCSSK